MTTALTDTTPIRPAYTFSGKSFFMVTVSRLRPATCRVTEEPTQDRPKTNRVTERPNDMRASKYQSRDSGNTPMFVLHRFRLDICGQTLSAQVDKDTKIEFTSTLISHTDSEEARLKLVLFLK